MNEAACLRTIKYYSSNIGRSLKYRYQTSRLLFPHSTFKMPNVPQSRRGISYQEI